MLKFQIPDMSCGHCKVAVTDAITGVDAAAKVTVDLDAKTATVSGTDQAQAIIAALAEEEFPATQIA